MGIFNKGTNIGKTIAQRVKGFPVWEKEPKKKPKKKPTCWVICPDFRVKTPKVVSKEGSEKDYKLSVQIFSETRKEALAALNHMIRCGKEEIEAGNKQFWLHCVTYGIQHKALYLVELKYIFRLKQLPEEIILQEVK